jgi:hypothetical protein
MATTREGTEPPQAAGEGGAGGESGSDARTGAGGGPEKQGTQRGDRKSRRSSVVTEREVQEEGNSIRPSRLRSRSVREDATVPASETAPGAKTDVSDRSSSESAPPPRAAANTGKPDSDPWTVPASVRDRFTQDGHRFYFPDGHPAFRDHGRKLSTPSENTEVVRSLIEIAHARGWQEITADGTDRFRQEAWRQGKLAGLEVRGYKPTEAERASLIRALARNAEGAREAVDASSSTAAPEDAASVPSASPTRSGDAERKRPDELIVGKLVDFGRESYRFDPHEEMSYFVQIQAPEGKRTIWGRDLQRALAKSLTQPQVGDEIAMRRAGSDAVTVKRRERNADGELVNERTLDAQRHHWVVEKAEFFEARTAAAQVMRNPTINAREAVKTHPELAGTYLQLRAAELAARQLRDPQDQKQFVSLIRGALADAVARGEPLQPVRLRERRSLERSTLRQIPERDRAPARG